MGNEDTVSIDKVYALQNKFKGSVMSRNNFWGQISYIKVRFKNEEILEGMLMISGLLPDKNEEILPCQLTFHAAKFHIVLNNQEVDKLLAAEICE